jgi:hypothetical protein
MVLESNGNGVTKDVAGCLRVYVIRVCVLISAHLLRMNLRWSCALRVCCVTFIFRVRCVWCALREVTV